MVIFIGWKHLTQFITEKLFRMKIIDEKNHDVFF